MYKHHFTDIASDVEPVSSPFTSYWMTVQIILITFLGRLMCLLPSGNVHPYEVWSAHSQNLFFLSSLLVAWACFLLFFIWIFFCAGLSQCLMQALPYWLRHILWIQILFKTLYYWVALQGKLPLVLLSVSFIPKLRFKHISLTSPLFDVTSQPFPLLFFLLHCFNSVFIWFTLSALLKLFGPILILIMEMYSIKMEREELFW